MKVRAARSKFDCRPATSVGLVRYVVTHAKVQCQAAADTPVILSKEAVFPGARAEHTGLSADLIVLDEACQDVGRFITARSGPDSVAPQEEVPLAGLGPEQVHLAANEVAAEFERVVPFDPAQAPGALVGVLRAPGNVP